MVINELVYEVPLIGVECIGEVMVSGDEFGSVNGHKMSTADDSVKMDH